MNNDTLPITDPQSGRPVRVHDATAEIAAVTKAAGRDPDAERAFIQARIALVESDHRLTDVERAAAVQHLKSLMR